MGKACADLGVDTWLGIDLPGFGIVRAQVRWSENGEVGCQFRIPIDVSELIEPASRKSFF
jgi:hypothetical protein